MTSRSRALRGRVPVVAHGLEVKLNHFVGVRSGTRCAAPVPHLVLGRALKRGGRMVDTYAAFPLRFALEVARERREHRTEVGKGATH